MPQEWQEEGDCSELEKPMGDLIRRQSWAGALQEEFIGSSNKRGDIVLYGAAIIDCCKNQRFPFVDCNFLSSNTANTIISLAWKLIQKHCTKNAVSCGFGHIYWRNA